MDLNAHVARQIGIAVEVQRDTFARGELRDGSGFECVALVVRKVKATEHIGWRMGAGAVG